MSHTATAQTITYSKDQADLHEYLKVTKTEPNKITFEIYMASGGCSEFKHKGIATLTKKISYDTENDGNNKSFKMLQYDSKDSKIVTTINIGVQKGYTNRASFSWYNAASEEDPCKTSSELLIRVN